MPYLISMAIIFLFTLGSLISSISVFNQSHNEILTTLDHNITYKISLIISLAIMVTWVVLSLLAGIKFTHPLNTVQMFRYPINTLSFAIINIFTQLFDFGILLFYPLFIIILYLMHISGMWQILLSILMIELFFSALILIVSILSLVIKIRKYIFPKLKVVFLGTILVFAGVLILPKFDILSINLISLNSAIEAIFNNTFIFPSTAFINTLKAIAVGEFMMVIERVSFIILELIILFIIYLFLLRSLGIVSDRENGTARKLHSHFSGMFRIELFLSEKIFTGSNNLPFIAKDIIYFLRNPRMLVWCFIVYIGTWYISFLPFNDLTKYIVMISIGLWGLMSLACNYFAYDNNGILNYFFTPVSSCQVIFQKNAAYTILSLSLTIPIFVWTIHTIDLNIMMLLITIPILAYQLAAINSIGNIISIYFPYSVRYRSVLGQFNPMESLPITFGLFAIAEGLPGVVIMLFHTNMYILLVSLVLLSALSIVVYIYLLKFLFPKILLKNREKLLSNIIRVEMKVYE